MPFRYQALVPIWDAVNHVTGCCNTRLHHCAKTGALQMIAAAPVPRGHQVRARTAAVLACLMVRYSQPDATDHIYAVCMKELCMCR